MPVILSERVEHLNILAEKLHDLNIPTIIYKSNITKKEEKEIQTLLQEVNKNNISRIIL
ncbi:MAG: hypothetical protein LBD88_00575 [Candidatus Peribacteria bacterium]|jgi:hypothetical protein|nr:hypothetical protein [Candidatus Peribacteria bacterium]